MLDKTHELFEDLGTTDLMGWAYRIIFKVTLQWHIEYNWEQLH